VARWGRLGLSVSAPFVRRCLNSPAMLRFHVPLIEPDLRISRIRLSEKVHAFACGRRDGSQRSWSSPKGCSSHGLQYQHGPNRAFLCLAPHHLRNPSASSPSRRSSPCVSSRLTQRSLTLRPACSLSRLLRPFDIESLSRFVTSSSVPTATGWNNPTSRAGTFTRWRTAP
jgi:hypothetical protein